MRNDRRLEATSFGEWLRDGLKMRRLSQAQFADAIGHRRHQTVGEWCRGQSLPDPAYFDAIARVLQLPNTDTLREHIRPARREAKDLGDAVKPDPGDFVNRSSPIPIGRDDTAPVPPDNAIGGDAEILEVLATTIQVAVGEALRRDRIGRIDDGRSVARAARASLDRLEIAKLVLDEARTGPAESAPPRDSLKARARSEVSVLLSTAKESD